MLWKLPRNIVNTWIRMVAASGGLDGCGCQARARVIVTIADKLMPLSSLEPRVAALSIHQHSDTPGPASRSSHPPAAPAAPAAPAGGQQTYAGVLRSPVPRPGCSSEPDPLIRIRNLGTRGSHLQFWILPPELVLAGTDDQVVIFKTLAR